MASASCSKTPDDREKDAPLSKDNVFWEKVYRATKVIFTGLLFVLVLFSAVVSKGSLLILTWNIFTPLNGTDVENGTFEGLFRNSDKNTVPSTDDTKTNVYYVWALLTLVVSPYVGSVTVFIWKLLSKKSKDNSEGKLDGTPVKRTCTPWLQLVAILPAILHSIGLSVLVFILLPSMNPISALWYCSSATLVPSIVRIIFSDDKSLIQQKGSTSKIAWHFVGRVSCLVLSVLSLTFWAVYISLASGPSISGGRIILFILSPILVSFGWWGNFVPEESSKATDFKRDGDCEDVSDANKATDGQRQPHKTPQCLKAIRQEINILNDHSYAGRHKMFLIIYTCKLIITFVMMVSIYGLPCFSLAFNRNESPVKRSSDVYGSTWLYKGDNCSIKTAFVIAVVGILASFVCHRCSMAAIKIVSQIQNFSLPLILVSPVTLITLVILSIENDDNACDSYFPTWKDDGNVDYLAYMVVASMTSYLSLLLLTSHIWTNKIERMKKGNEIFLKPLYCAALFDQSLMLNRRKEKKFVRENRKLDRDAYTKTKKAKGGDSVPLIYLCATMWHEDEHEMRQLLKSLFSMDAHQSKLHSDDSDVYNIEAHIFFDDAFVKNCVNQYVKTFITEVEGTARSEYPDKERIEPHTKTATPYGGRLSWELHGGNKLIAHLKDKSKIRAKKRWSQVMYMYYFLSHILHVKEKHFEKRKEKAKNIYILALDGDVDFKPSAVKLLVDRMKRNPEVGAACGRIHPIGSGAMVWYQKFEYAISHWLVKATEHVAGCVLCSPGCFSLFRGSALMDKVMKEYTTQSTEARHYIQYDQGEDRWLCTLLLKQGYKVDYCAASDAYTFAPESFKEFYNQRRRWTPSTMANIMDLLASWRGVTKSNNYVSLPYIALHLFWFISSLVTPGVLLLMIVGATNLAYSNLSLTATLLINLTPVTIFMLVCFFGKTDTQISAAAALSIMYSLVMIIVLIGLIRQSVEQGFCSISTPFFLGVIGVFVITGVMHPQEVGCLLHGFLFFISIPSMSILLMIYSIINMNNVSWGTRENQLSSGQNGMQNGEKNMLQGYFERISCCAQPTVAVAEDNQEVEQNQPVYEAFFNPNSSNVMKIEKKENDFWDKLIRQYLHPSGNIKQAKTIQEAEESSVEQTHSEETVGSREEVCRLGESNDDRVRSVVEENKDIKSSEGEKLKEANIKKQQSDVRQQEKRLKEANDKKQESELRQLRNKASLAFFLINGLSMTIVFYLQQVNLDTSGELSIQLSCSDGGTLPIEPISMTFTVIFGFLLVFQFICMLVHRCKTFLQINSITKIKEHCDVQKPCIKDAPEIIPKCEQQEEEAIKNPEQTNAVCEPVKKKVKKAKHKKKKSRIEPDAIEADTAPKESISYTNETGVNSRVSHRPKAKIEKNGELEPINNGTSCDNLTSYAVRNTSQPLSLRQAVLPDIGSNRYSDIHVAPVHT